MQLIRLLPHVVVILVMLGSVSLAGADDRPAKPNVVLLLTDDLGWQASVFPAPGSERNLGFKF